MARVFRGSSDPHISLPREGKILLRGPANAALQIPRVAKARGLSEERVREAAVKNGWTRFDLPTILDHEVAVIG